MIKTISNQILKLESSIAYSTFELKDIDAFIQLFEDEKKKAIQELKELQEKALSEVKKTEEGESQSNVAQRKKELVNRLAAQEVPEYQQIFDQIINKSIDSIDTLEKHIILSFKIKAGKRTFASDNWLDILSKADEPIYVFTAKLECPKLNKKIFLEIREIYGTTNIYHNRYVISGTDQDWVNKNIEIFNNIITDCKNNRKSWFDLLYLLEPLLSLLIAGSIFLFLRMMSLFITYSDIYYLESNIQVKFLLTIIALSFIWISLGVGITKRLIDIVRNQYPTVEISVNSFTRENARKRLIYVAFLIALPYLLNLFISMPKK